MKEIIRVIGRFFGFSSPKPDLDEQLRQATPWLGEEQPRPPRGGEDCEDSFTNLRAKGTTNYFSCLSFA